tara:strand:+ start:546 stop:680 length:135 start_codon:yes stop_codon:yes gene_type:complete
MNKNRLKRLNTLLKKINRVSIVVDDLSIEIARLIREISKDKVDE